MLVRHLEMIETAAQPYSKVQLRFMQLKETGGLLNFWRDDVVLPGGDPMLIIYCYCHPMPEVMPWVQRPYEVRGNRIVS